MLLTKYTQPEDKILRPSAYRFSLWADSRFRFSSSFRLRCPSIRLVPATAPPCFNPLRSVGFRTDQRASSINRKAFAAP